MNRRHFLGLCAGGLAALGLWKPTRAAAAVAPPVPGLRLEERWGRYLSHECVVESPSYESLFELGNRTPYRRYMTFPLTASLTIRFVWGTVSLFSFNMSPHTRDRVNAMSGSELLACASPCLFPSNCPELDWTMSFVQTVGADSGADVSGSWAAKPAGSVTFMVGSFSAHGTPQVR